MKITLNCKIPKPGPDADYFDEAQVSMEIESKSADMIFSLDGKEVFRLYCNDMQRAIRAFDI